jgi:autotransporter-associated beta strand protein
MVVSSGVLNVGGGGGAVIIGGGAGTGAGPEHGGKGSLVINGGTVNVGAAGTSAQGVDASKLWLNGYGSAAASGSIDLNGGMLSTARTIENGSIKTANAFVNLNGGTLQAAGAIDLIAAASNRRTTVNVLSGGAIIDTQAFNASISEILRNGGGGGGLTKNGTGTLTLSATNTYTGITTVSAGTLALGHATDTLSSSSAVKVDGATAVLSIAGNSDTVGAVSLKNGGSITGTGGTLTGASYAVESGSVSAKLGGAGIALTKSTEGTVTLSGINSYTGATTVSAGTLAVDGTGSINSSAVTVNGGTFRYNSSVAYSSTLTFTSGTISGTNLTGSLGGQTIGTGKTIAPGNSPGTATTTSQTWAGGGNYAWEINDANATAGADPGWDLINGSGALTITATSGSQFNLLLSSLALSNAAGLVHDFDNTASYNWLIADFASITGFAANVFSINTTGFTNTLNGTFGVVLGDTVLGGDNSQIYLTYTSIPEPRAALLGGLGLLMLLRRRR